MPTNSLITSTMQPTQHLEKSIDVKGMEGYFFACCPSEHEYEVDDILDAIDVNGQITFLIRWAPSIVPVHCFIGPLIHMMKPQIVQIYGDDEYQACLERYYEISKQAVSQPYGHYPFFRIIQIFQSDGVLQAELEWNNSTAMIEDLHESLLPKAQDLVVKNFGYTTWTLLQYLYLSENDEPI